MSIKFTTGEHRITPAAAAILELADLPSDALFARHASGDWGNAHEYYRGENDKAVREGISAHTIQSAYLVDGVEVLCITAADRARLP
jgi:hypothetical protein